MLQKIRNNKFYVDGSKIEFALRQLEFWGHMLDGKGIRVDPKKIKAIVDWMVP